MFALCLAILYLGISGSNGCATDRECGVFQTCSNGNCVSNNAGCNVACAANQVCVPPNCVAAPVPAPGPCTNDSQCPLFQNCVSGRCQASNAGCPPCSAGQVCIPPNCVTVPANGAASTTAAPATSCPAGWSPFNKSCYFVTAGQFFFSQASNRCSQMGSKVVWFDSTNASTFQNEMNFVNGLALSLGVNSYWIGLNQVFGQWMWTNGSPMTFSNWRPSQPDRCCGANVTCVLANYANRAGQWDDAGCEILWTNPQGFICKKPLP